MDMSELVGAKGKFTFRKQPRETGLASVARPNPDTMIKIAGKECGVIEGPSAFGTDFWKVRIMIKDPSKGGGWRWATFRINFNSEPEARDFIIRNQELLQTKYPIHQHED